MAPPEPPPPNLPGSALPERRFVVDATARVRQAPQVQEFPLGEEEMMLFLQGREALHTLNTTAWAVWDLCDGQRTIAEIAQELSGVTGHPVEAVLADVRTTVERLGALSLLDLA
jgi:Coenzyme PQQ synthesis protein D (PqqD)